MYTYIIESQGVYKIGKAKDVDKRIRAYKTHNPTFNLLKTITGDYETKLHKWFADKRSHLEWYNLVEEDINNIDYIITQPDKEEIRTSTKIVEAEPYIKVMRIAGGKKKAMSLGSAATSLFLYIIYNMPDDDQYLQITPEQFSRATNMTSKNTYTKAVEELWEKGYINPTIQKYVYWLNPAILSGCNRIDKWSDNVVVKSDTSIKLKKK